MLNEELAGTLVLDKPISNSISSPAGTSASGDHDNRLAALASGLRTNETYYDDEFGFEIGSRTGKMEIIGQEGSGKLEFKSPSGLTMNNDGHLVICEIENNRLQILTKEFTHIRTIIGFREPRDVCFNKDKRYLITDNHKLIILDEDFHKVEVIGSNKFGKGRSNSRDCCLFSFEKKKNFQIYLTIQLVLVLTNIMMMKSSFVIRITIV